jgi:dTDP-glucose pyrophosphorylase
MIIIIPIGGIGQRFKDNGYKTPKALIDIYGKPIISYLLDNLNTDNIYYIYIPYNNEYKKFGFEDFLINQYPKINFKFHCLKNNTRGAAETIDIGLNHLNEIRDIPVLCLDCDSFYLCNIISKWNGENCIFSFDDFNENAIFSYVKINNVNKIIEIKEKEKISNNACSGAYGFNSIKELKKYTSKIINENITQKSEFYMSGVIKEMIKNKKCFKNITIQQNNFIQLGIPVDIKKYCTDIIIKSIKSNKGHMFDMNGHSNFDINIVNINNITYLCKSSNNYEDSIRLYKQIEKQEIHHKLFNLNIPNIIFKSPIVNNKTYILMDYLNNTTTCFNYIIDNNYLVLDKIFIFIKDIIDKYIYYSIYKKIDKTLILDKINSIKKNINTKKILNEQEYKFIIKKINILENNCEQICNIMVPVGYCHGDLTLSNMLFSTIDNNIYLIDFLDSFIETPLFDIIKFRQDTKFYWSLKMINLEMDQNKIKIALNYLDNKIDNYFKKYEFYNSQLYDYFEIINLLRILQYCKNKDIKDFLLDCLHL